MIVNVSSVVLDSLLRIKTRQPIATASLSHEDEQQTTNAIGPLCLGVLVPQMLLVESVGSSATGISPEHSKLTSQCMSKADETPTHPIRADSSLGPAIYSRLAGQVSPRPHAASGAKGLLVWFENIIIDITRGKVHRSWMELAQEEQTNQE